MTDVDASPADKARAEIRRTWGSLAMCITHDDVERAGWEPATGVDTWGPVYRLVLARACVRALRAAPEHRGAAGWRRMIEAYRSRRSA